MIAVRHGEASELRPARQRLEQLGPARGAAPGAVVWAVLDKVVDDYAPVVDGIDNDIEEVEQEIFARGNDSTQRIYFLKREVIEFHRAVSPLLPPLEALERGAYPQVDEELRRYFRDVADHARRVDEQVNSQRELLTSILEANLALLWVKQNEVVRAISAWAAIIAVPTFLASIWGMNFEHMPELDERWGYPVALAMMAVAVVLRCTASSAASSGSSLAARSTLSTLAATAIDVAAPLLLVAVAVAYARRCVDPGPPRASRSAIWRQVSFAAGLLILLLADLPPISTIAEELVVAHMAQHLLIGDLAGPVDRPRAHRPDAAAAARGPRLRLASAPRQPACRAAALGAQPLPLAPRGALRGRARRARCCTSPSTPASSPSAWRCGCRWSGRCRSRPGSATGRKLRLHGRRAPARGGARQHPDLVGRGRSTATTRPARPSGRSRRSPTRARPAT